MKSRIESTKDANTEREEDVNVTIILAIKRNTFAIKFTKIAKFTIGVKLSKSEKSPGRRADSSSNDGRREGGWEYMDGR
jgi:hypothetical protein